MNFVLLEELKNNRNWRIRLGEYHLREIRIDAKKKKIKLKKMRWTSKWKNIKFVLIYLRKRANVPHC